MTLAHFAGKIARSLGFTEYVERAKAYRDAYRSPKMPQTVLSGAYFEPVTRVRGGKSETPAASPLHDLWAGVPGGHKWLHYFDIYDELFASLRDRPIRMLEIGVYRGGSLQMWRQALHRESIVVGIDIDASCARFDKPVDRCHVRIGSQADSEFLAAVVAEFGPFDVILDDGSHLCSHMIASFNHLFLSALAPRGIYIAEDTHTNFWPNYRDQAYSFVDLCKDLVDLMNSHYALKADEHSYRIGHAEQVASLNVPRISAHIQEVSFRDSIIAVRKKPVGPLPTSQHN